MLHVDVHRNDPVCMVAEKAGLLTVVILCIDCV